MQSEDVLPPEPYLPARQTAVQNASVSPLRAPNRPAGHALHPPLEPWRRKRPAGHGNVGILNLKCLLRWQPVEPRAENRPSGQNLHGDGEVWAWYLPTGQFRHVSPMVTLFVLPTVVNLPDGHDHPFGTSPTYALEAQTSTQSVSGHAARRSVSVILPQLA